MMKGKKYEPKRQNNSQNATRMAILNFLTAYDKTKSV